MNFYNGPKYNEIIKGVIAIKSNVINSISQGNFTGVKETLDQKSNVATN